MALVWRATKRAIVTATRAMTTMTRAMAMAMTIRWAMAKAMWLASDKDGNGKGDSNCKQ
jgi:hypothetical protein